MIGLRRALVLGIASGALALTGSRSGPITIGPRSGPLDPKAIYSRESKEHYLTAEQADFTRPGHHIKISRVTIGADCKPVADA